ncbi:helix-turn-helix transcriptional regulator [Agreia sp. VKM Ac-1783]|uniref:helix-turn-helix domain-containing protein n=1 Tax=Agreia sp. VKM Ac-1783 TaxID=1938889 RepID=UPI001482CF55|nr:helix-turn-helix transcriptional regulator [Agreia sp. VKM Ac-1783]
MVRQLRVSRDLKQTDVAKKLNVSQSTISKIESGATPLDGSEVEKIVLALVATPQERSELLLQEKLTHQAPLSYQVILDRGSDQKQFEIASYESSSRAIDEYEPTIVPGLLQVPQYMKYVMRGFGVPSSDVESAVHARIQRQQILTSADRKFHFILSESSLYNRPASPATQCEQLESLILHFGRRNTTIGIVPLERGTVPLAMSGFRIFDSAFATAETTVAEQQITDRRDVATLVRLHAEIASHAIYGSGALRVIRKAITTLEEASNL